MNRALKVLGLGAGVFAASRIARRIGQPSFKGRTVVVTGGSRGLGLTLARLFADEGARLVIAARSDTDLAEARRELESRGADVVAVSVDLRSRDGAQELVRRAVSRFKGIDVLINNAGVMQVGPHEQMGEEDFRNAMDIHFWAAHHLTEAALPFLRKSDMPRIVNIGSIGGEVAVPHMAPYVASKFAIVGYSEALRSELVTEGIRVTTVNPGLMRTGSHVNALFKGQREQEYAWFASMAGIPLLSTTAEAAARKIIRACRVGRPHLVITLPAKLAVAADAIAPNLSSHIRDVVGHVLPSDGEEKGDEPRKGREVSGRAPDALTYLADKEVEEHHE